MSLLVKLRSNFLQKTKTIKICFIGLDKAGKSSIIKCLLEEKFNESIDKRTIGMEVAKLHSAGIEFIVWDIGGQKGFRETLWDSYLLGSMAIIYVIDSTDQKRIQESKTELERFIFNNQKFDSTPILLLANKQDKDNALEPDEIGTLLNLRQVKFKNVKLFGVSCKTGLNIQESFNWLCNQISFSEKSISFSPSVALHSINV